MAKHAKQKLFFLVLALVVGLSSFTRLYRIGETHTFHNDEGRDVLITLKMIETRRPVLLGPQTSTGNMYLGPLYYYLMVPPLLLSNMDPVGPAIMVAIFGVVTSLLIFLYSNKRLGLLGATFSALVFAITPSIVTFTRNSWNPNLVPFVAVLVIYVATRLLNNFRSAKSHFVLGLLSGVLIQLHYVALLLPIILYLFLVISNRRNIKALVSGALYALIGFVLMTAPFWLFEIRHGWVNTQALFTYLSSQSGSKVELSYIARLWRNLLDFTEVLGGTRPNNPDSVPMWLKLAFWLLILLSARASNLKKGISKRLGLLLLTVLFGSLLGYSVLSQKLEIHYLSFIFPVYALLVGYAVSIKGKLKYVSILLISAIILYNLPILNSNLMVESSHQVLRAQSVASYISDQAGDRDYNVVPSSTNSRDATYQYYLALLSNPPTNTASDTVFMICEDAPCAESDFHSPLLFARGPSHPAIDNYLGHPFMTNFSGDTELISMEHIVYGTWVAELRVKPASSKGK